MVEKKYIYADNAATSPMSPKALEAMIPYLSEQYANISQPYSFARKAKRAVQEARECIASCIGASPNEIFFTSGGSESNNWVINGAIDFEMDIVTSSIEHHSILRSVEHASRMGSKVTYLPVSPTGLINPKSLMDAVECPGTLVSIMLANNEIGSIQKIADLANYTHQSQGFFHTDAVQAVGHIKIDVKSLGVDMLSASAHKFNGPKGIGFLYIREGLKWPNLIYGGSQESGLRAGTENVAAIVGMAIALKENVNNLADNIIHLRELEDTLLYELSKNNIQFKRNGDIRHVPGNLSLSFQGFEGEMLLHRLDLKGIMVSTGSACDSKETQISHVLNAIGLSEEDAVGTIRISLGKQNTESDAKEIALAISQIVGDPTITKHNINEYSESPSETIKITEDTPSAESTLIKSSDKIFYINTIGCNVRGRLIEGDKIVILKGSILRAEVTNTFGRKENRNKILSSYCTKTDEGYVCNRDLPPMTPSGASGLAQGRSSNGKRDWKDANGHPLAVHLS